ncbi:hypothetical protein PHJA_002821200 [Phtheirospermum japonicum]|uniref:Uncharacterized protein n=1 Tax=Phtheirospermum japonicum TaxID=374723 RepID=A0A830DLI3_9LAMI|nr:hypothetical protein PHJA_002821200 [Phtheirospermum japonicum]
MGSWQASRCRPLPVSGRQQNPSAFAYFFVVWIFDGFFADGLHPSAILLKIGPDRPVRPVRPGTGHHTGPVFMCKPLGSRTGQTGQESVEPVNLGQGGIIWEPSPVWELRTNLSHSIFRSHGMLVDGAVNLQSMGKIHNECDC